MPTPVASGTTLDWHGVQEGHPPARTLDLPFLIRETVRKYQWSVSLATLWHKA